MTRRSAALLGDLPQGWHAVGVDGGGPHRKCLNGLVATLLLVSAVCSPCRVAPGRARAGARPARSGGGGGGGGAPCRAAESSRFDFLTCSHAKYFMFPLSRIPTKLRTHFNFSQSDAACQLAGRCETLYSPRVERPRARDTGGVQLFCRTRVLTGRRLLGARRCAVWPAPPALLWQAAEHGNRVAAAQPQCSEDTRVPVKGLVRLNT